MKKVWILLFIIIFHPMYGLDEAHINLNDKASLQRGARIYINYCSGCHSMKYLRYNQMAQGLAITEKILKENFIFSGDKVGETIQVAMATDDAKKWFGQVPPDLTEVVRVRGVNWIVTYLRSFYKDAGQPWGTNNLVYPNVSMPNVLLALQGEQVPIYRLWTTNVNGRLEQHQEIERLALVENGTMTQEEFDVAMSDVVNFLAYSSEPFKRERERIGIIVLIFLGILAFLLYLLKKEYWRNIR